MVKFASVAEPAGNLVDTGLNVQFFLQVGRLQCLLAVLV